MSMSTLDRRLQVLVHPDQYAQLERAAAVRGCSVGAIVRQAVDAYLDPGGPARERSAQAFLDLPMDDGTGMEWREMKDAYDSHWHALPS